MRRETRGRIQFKQALAGLVALTTSGTALAAVEPAGLPVPVAASPADSCGPGGLYSMAALPPVRIACRDTGAVCLPLPADFDGQLHVDGASVAARPCGLDSVARYSLSDLSTVGLEGPFEVVWRIGERAIRDRVASTGELLAMLRRNQPAAGWHRVGTEASEALSGAYSAHLGTLTLVDAPTGIQREAEVVPVLAPIGVAIGLPAGRFEVVASDGVCTDTLAVEVECVQTSRSATTVIEGIQTVFCPSVSGRVLGIYEILTVDGASALVTPHSEPGCIGVTGLSEGSTRVVLEACGPGDGGCVRVELDVETLPRGAVAPPLARRDLIGVALNGQRAFDVTANDEIVGEVTDLAVAGDTRGQVRVDRDFRIHYTAPSNWCGQERVAYTVCSPGGCDTASALVQVICEDVVVFNAISPNGDGANDRFTVLGLENYPGNRLAVFDRSGRLVFATDDYAGDWAGTRNGAPLPPGVYFYVLDVDGLQTKSGPLLVGY